MPRNRKNEWAFFIILNSNDIWTIFKQFMYIGKKKSNIYDYKNGDIAAYYGYIEVLKNNDNLYFTQYAIEWASQNGYVEVIKWLYNNRPERWTYTAMNLASKNGHLEIIKWLHQNKIEEFTTYAAYAIYPAARNGHLEIVKYRRMHCLCNEFGFYKRPFRNS
jgi:hypothetical protein